jgi:hypothetical protein
VTVHTRTAFAAARLLAFPALLALLCGCTGALWTTSSFRSGAPARGGSLAETLSGSGAVAKADVLAALGPPGEVLPLAAGDVFVYRVRRSDVDVLNLNTSILTGVFVPIYARIAGSQADDILYVMFDDAGRVRDVARAPP